MKLPASIPQLAERIDRMSVRERALIAVASLALLLMGWDTLSMEPLRARQSSLRGELSSVQGTIDAAAQSLQANDANDASLRQRLAATEAELKQVDQQLAADTAGLITPQRMSAVIYDVLRRQQGVRLISLRNKAPQNLATLVPKPESPATVSADEAKEVADESAASQSTSAIAKAASGAGPYLHPVELVVEGSYLDVLAYTRALEALPWRFYWKRLDLDAGAYPHNRVHIELCTLSLDASWLGV